MPDTYIGIIAAAITAILAMIAKLIDGYLADKKAKIELRTKKEDIAIEGKTTEAAEMRADLRAELSECRVRLDTAQTKLESERERHIEEEEELRELGHCLSVEILELKAELLKYGQIPTKTE